MLINLDNLSATETHPTPKKWRRQVLSNLDKWAECNYITSISDKLPKYFGESVASYHRSISIDISSQTRIRLQLADFN
jgi:hypothetical protein